jgi:hypothetical protein
MKGENARNHPISDASTVVKAKKVELAANAGFFCTNVM